MAIALTSDILLFVELLSRSDLAVTIKDAQGRYVIASASFCTWVSCSADGLGGLTDEEIFEGSDAEALGVADHAAWQKIGVSSHEQRVTCAGTRREFLILRSLLGPAESGKPQCLICVWKDLTDARRLNTDLVLALKQLEQQQHALEALRLERQDAVVGNADGDLYQRAQFDEQLRREVDLSSREHREFALVAIRLDSLSDATLAAGGVVQNHILEALARLLRSNTRAMDASCRVDETRFAVLLSGVGLATAHSRMEALRRQCATQIIAFNGQALGFTVSMGVASFPHTATNEQDLLGAADTALQEALKRGGNHVTLASIRFEGA